MKMKSKKTNTAILFLIISLIMQMFATLEVKAQDTSSVQLDSVMIEYMVVIPSQASFNENQRLNVKRILETMLARNNMAGNIKDTPFVIVPEITDVATESTQTGISSMTLATGTLLLLAKNRYDGTVFNQIQIPLRATFNPLQTQDALSELIKCIKPTDKRFVRFLKTTTKRIEKRYADSEIVVP